MSKPTIQAQRAIDSMKAAGFARKDYRVKTERRNIPKEYGGGYEFGMADITLYASAAEALPRVPLMLANGIDVTIIMTKRQDGTTRYSVYATPTEKERFGKEPRLLVQDYINVDPEYGFSTLHTELKAWAIYSDALSQEVTSHLVREY